MNWVWNVRERIISKLGSSIPSRIDFPLTKVGKAEQAEVGWGRAEVQF